MSRVSGRRGKNVGVTLFLLPLLLAAAFADARAQMTITGSVTDEGGHPVSQAQVLIAALRLSTTTGEDGTYQLMVPASRLDGDGVVDLTARRIGLKAQAVTVALRPGAVITRDFVLESDPFLLEAVVVTGQGMRMERAKLAVTINSVSGEEIADAKEPNVISALAGKAPNVEVTSSTGDPGGGAYIRIRGSNSILGGTQPLLIVDGVEITNASNVIDTVVAGTAYANRMIDINPEDIESIEVLKGAAAPSPCAPESPAHCCPETAAPPPASRTAHTPAHTDRCAHPLPPPRSPAPGSCRPACPPPGPSR
jgi:outer membrane receptor protein involved in Fe transport